MSFVGYPFTWSNGRKGRDNIQCRLDKSLCYGVFMNTFPMSSVHHLPRQGSDHAVLCIVVEKDQEKKRRPHLFRFEEVWTKDPRCESLVKQIWKGVQDLNIVFKEYRTGSVAKELKRIEALLKEDIRWDAEEEEI